MKRKRLKINPKKSSFPHAKINKWIILSGVFGIIFLGAVLFLPPDGLLNYFAFFITLTLFLFSGISIFIKNKLMSASLAVAVIILLILRLFQLATLINLGLLLGTTVCFILFAKKNVA